MLTDSNHCRLSWHLIVARYVLFNLAYYRFRWSGHYRLPGDNFEPYHAFRQVDATRDYLLDLYFVFIKVSDDLADHKVLSGLLNLQAKLYGACFAEIWSFALDGLGVDQRGSHFYRAESAQQCLVEWNCVQEILASNVDYGPASLRPVNRLNLMERNGSLFAHNVDVWQPCDHLRVIAL